MPTDLTRCLTSEKKKKKEEEEGPELVCESQQGRTRTFGERERKVVNKGEPEINIIL
jgi:hypothetical protein